MAHFHVVRPKLSARPAGFGGESDDCLFGEQLEWGRAVAATYRALAAPTSGQPFPIAPAPHDDVFVACAYWTPLLHLLVYTLAWSRPDLGMRWWYDAGKPTDDPRLAFIAEVWDTDGQLDWFTAWLWSSAEPFLSPIAPRAHQPPVIARVRADKADLSALEARAADTDIPNPLSGGSDPLHLRAHWTGPLEPCTSEPLMVHSDPSLRRASLMLDATAGWYWALTDAGDQLPALGSHSWRVEVTTKSAGWLGTYRRSRETGLWFSGRHSLHVRGNGV